MPGQTIERRPTVRKNPNKDLVGYTATGEDEGGTSQVQGEPGQLSETLFLVQGGKCPQRRQHKGYDLRPILGGKSVKTAIVKCFTFCSLKTVGENNTLNQKAWKERLGSDQSTGYLKGPKKPSTVKIPRRIWRSLLVHLLADPDWATRSGREGSAVNCLTVGEQ